MTRQHILIEHVPVEDPMFQQLSRGRDTLYGDCARDVFEALLGSQFTIATSRTLPNGRTLYLAASRS